MILLIFHFIFFILGLKYSLYLERNYNLSYTIGDMPFTLLSCASLCSLMRIYWRVFQKYYIYDINALSCDSLSGYEKDPILCIDTLNQSLVNFSVKDQISGFECLPSLWQLLTSQVCHCSMKAAKMIHKWISMYSKSKQTVSTTKTFIHITRWWTGFDSGVIVYHFHFRATVH